MLKEAESSSLNFIVVVTAALNSANGGELKAYLDECVRGLRKGGLLFVQGRPEYLPELGVYLDQHLNFKYWIAIESTIQHRVNGLPSVHAAVLLFTKGNERFNVKRVRFPHQYCDFCGRTLKDWGGKAHLMHPDGYVISDVWKDLPQLDNYTQISEPVLDTILRMLDFEPRGEREADLLRQAGMQASDSEIRGIVGPKEGIGSSESIAESAIQYRLPGFAGPEEAGATGRLPLLKMDSTVVNEVGDKMFNVVHHGDAVEILQQYPDNSIDLVFADPPYNLDKAYHVYDDERADEEYVKWCNSWLREYVRVLKSTGSLYVLNLPRWTMYHAAFLNRHLHFQNWIVWDAMAEPRGKLMPAHYGLLFYTKHPKDFTFNYDEVGELDAHYYCLRRSCIRKRKAAGVDDKSGSDPRLVLNVGQSAEGGQAGGTVMIEARKISFQEAWDPTFRSYMSMR
ncbi:MAG: DNA methyltransferase [Chloroflexota bacterium]|nr:DNA methyltransferase [Chloroflexota bacterium]